MPDLTLEQLRTELIARLETIDGQLKVIRIHTDAYRCSARPSRPCAVILEACGPHLTILPRPTFTAGEVEAMHSDIDRVQNREMQILTRLATIERVLRKHSMLPPSVEER